MTYAGRGGERLADVELLSLMELIQILIYAASKTEFCASIVFL